MLAHLHVVRFVRMRGIRTLKQVGSTFRLLFLADRKKRRLGCAERKCAE